MTEKVGRILIIDDEKGIRKSLESYLSDYGYEVHGVETGESAFEYLREFHVDVAIVDLILPGISGEELILELKRSYPDMKFIIHTGSVDFTMTRKLRSIGLSLENIIHKPQIDMSCFIEKLKTI